MRRIGWLCWWIAAVFILVGGARTRAAMPKLPLITPDSFLYLLPAINGGHYTIGPRSFVYPMFCRAVIGVSGSLQSITLVQHILGLIGPMLLFAAWGLLGVKLWTRPLARVAHAVLGLVLLLLLVPSGVFVIYEQQTMLESLNAFFQCVLAALLCLLWLPMRPIRRVLLSSLTAGLGVFMYYANPRWGAAMPAVILLALIAGIAGRDSMTGWFRVVWPILASSFAIYFSLGQIQARLVPPDPWIGTFTAKHLLWMHADLAANEFRRDLALPIPPTNASLLRVLIEKIDQAVAGYDARSWPGLTFNADAMIVRPNNPDEQLMAAFKDDPDGYRRFCLRYFGHIVWHQPRAYFSKVWRVALFYYSGSPDDGAFREIAAPMTDVLPVGAPIARSLAENATPAYRAVLKAAADELESKAVAPIVFQPPAWLWVAVRWARIGFLPLTLLGAGCSLVVLVWRRSRFQGPLFVLSCVNAGAIVVLFAQVLTLAVATITAGRYADAIRALASFTLVTSVAIIASFTIVVLNNVRK